MTVPGSEIEYAVAAIETAVKLMHDSEALMRSYPATTDDHRAAHAVIGPLFRNAVDFLDRHHAHMASVKVALAKVSAK